ncbi:MAG: uracil-DNA glycosylase [Candidatus Thermoplasmatota archaeon]|jgi:uracil-DNA glycosylase family 4|nr:uracil-DNA glycosylase [Candidatus Thermoplasmatota archaeon]
MQFSEIGELNTVLVNCRECKRLVEFRERVAQRPGRFLGTEFWSRPVPGFGDIHGKILILGLAPAATGGNRTGRVFTGDKSATFLISSLNRVGLANKADSVSRDDGLILFDMYITAVLKCVPPEDKPSTQELENCKKYFFNEIYLMKNLRAVVVLGRVAFNSYLKYLKASGKDVNGIEFKHGKHYDLNGIRLYCSYHPSPRNVNTGRLKREDFVSLLLEIKNFVSSSQDLID